MRRAVYMDRAGNKLFITGKRIYAINNHGALVNRQGVMAMLRRAHKARVIKFRK